MAMLPETLKNKMSDFMVLEFLKSNVKNKLENEYHNSVHCEKVYESVLENPQTKTLDETVQMALETAALFHDACYSKKDDEEDNFVNAVECFELFVEKNSNEEEIRFDKTMIDIVILLILSTNNKYLGVPIRKGNKEGEFYFISDEALELKLEDRCISDFFFDDVIKASDILRDADMTQMLEEKWARKLYEEKGELYNEEFIYLFFSYYKPFTKHGQELVLKNYPDIKFRAYFGYRERREYEFERMRIALKAKLLDANERNLSPKVLNELSQALLNVEKTKDILRNRFRR